MNPTTYTYVYISLQWYILNHEDEYYITLMYVCMYVQYVCMYVCIYILLYIYKSLKLI